MKTTRLLTSAFRHLYANPHYTGVQQMMPVVMALVGKNLTSSQHARGIDGIAHIDREYVVKVYAALHFVSGLHSDILYTKSHGQSFSKICIHIASVHFMYTCTVMTEGLHFLYCIYACMTSQCTCVYMYSIYTCVCISCNRFTNEFASYRFIFVLALQWRLGGMMISGKLMLENS